MVRIGIIGCNYGRLVLLPAFRNDRRCEVVALAGTDAERTAELARAAAVPMSFGDWRSLVDHPDVDAVVIATTPGLQPEIALRAIELGKPVFAEKPLATDLAGAERIAQAAAVRGITTMIDFNFSQIPAWQRAKALLDVGTLGRLRHVEVNWNVENYGTRIRARNWKTLATAGGGALGNFVSHSFFYLEWFCGPITGLSARLSGLPDVPEFETNVHLALRFGSGAAGHLAMSCASYLGSGHRIEFYGEDGTMTLVNETTDYMRGFRLRLGRRPDASLAEVAVEDPLDPLFPQDGRIAPAARLVHGFLDGIEQRRATATGFAEGLRVQALLDAARRANDLGRWLDLGPSSMEGRS